MWDVYMTGNRGIKTTVIRDGVEKEITIPDIPFYTVEDRENGLIIDDDGKRALSVGSIPSYYQEHEYTLARIRAKIENARNNQQDVELRG